MHIYVKNIKAETLFFKNLAMAMLAAVLSIVEFSFLFYGKCGKDEDGAKSARVKQYYENDLVKMIESNHKRTEKLFSQVSWQREPVAYLFSSLYHQNLELIKASYVTEIDRSKVFTTIYIPIKQTAVLIQKNDQKIVAYLQKESPFSLGLISSKRITLADIESLDHLSVIGDDAKILDRQQKLNFYPGSNSVYSYHAFMARYFALLNRLEKDMADGKQDAQFMRDHIEKAQKILRHPYYDEVFKKLILDSLSDPKKIKDL